MVWLGVCLCVCVCTCLKHHQSQILAVSLVFLITESKILEDLKGVEEYTALKTVLRSKNETVYNFVAP